METHSHSEVCYDGMELYLAVVIRSHSVVCYDGMELYSVVVTHSHSVVYCGSHSKELGC